MIQELLGGSSSTGFLSSERKIPIPFSSPISTTCPTSTPILTTTTTNTSIVTNPSSTPQSVGNNITNTNSSDSNTNQQNLKCPRCDSTNTKFCYYNNYNLTQPRHFCKTCRRYWTKGGTLRNVPIGGGCRKNKTTTPNSSPSSSGLVKSSSNAMAKAKASLSTELLVNGNPGFLGSGLLDHFYHNPDLQAGSPNPILWPSLPQNSHILSLLRGSTQFPNPNPNPNHVSHVFSPVKTEGITNTSTTLGLDSYGNGAPSNLLGSYSRSNQQQGNGFLSGSPDTAPNNGNSNNSNILEIYQRLKSSSNYNYCGNEGQGSVVLGNMVGSISPSSPMNSTNLDPGQVGGGDHFGGYGFMNSHGIISGWSDFPTVPINGAFP